MKIRVENLRFSPFYITVRYSVCQLALFFKNSRSFARGIGFAK